MEKIYDLGDTEIYCEIYKEINSRMYIFIGEGRALIVDPCISEETVDFFKAERISHLLIILTHEHYDHISGVNYLRERFDTEVIASTTCAKMTISPRKNQAQYFRALMRILNKNTDLLEYYDENYSCEVDETFDGEYIFNWQQHTLQLTETPGHSEGSICILVDNEIVFTGDSLVNVAGEKIIVKGMGSSREDYLEKTTPYLQSLPDKVIVFPGHGDIAPLADLKVDIENFK